MTSQPLVEFTAAVKGRKCVTCQWIEYGPLSHGTLDKISLSCDPFGTVTALDESPHQCC
uniref:Uncharacterized protein n=1 Tax=Anguilla anguilla TaxID=7936 RepID=A0A0E9TCB7_ANGAN